MVLPKHNRESVGAGGADKWGEKGEILAFGTNYKFIQGNSVIITKVMITDVTGKCDLFVTTAITISCTKTLSTIEWTVP